jgi:hypothetical protein
MWLRNETCRVIKLGGWDVDSCHVITARECKRSSLLESPLIMYVEKEICDCVTIESYDLKSRGSTIVSFLVCLLKHNKTLVVRRKALCTQLDCVIR